MTYRKFTSEKFSSSFLVRINEYYSEAKPLKISKYSVIFKDVTNTLIKQNIIERFVLQYKMTEEEPTQQEIDHYEDKLEEIKVEKEMQRLHSEQLNINFRKELKELLKKYNASIDFSCSDCSDTHGIYGAKLEVCFQLSNNTTVFDLCNGWSVDKHDF